MSHQPATGATPPRAVVVGEALVDVVVRPDGSTRESAGGSPYNVAVGLARLGVRTALRTRLGTDAHGDLLRDRAVASGVEVLADAAPRTSTATARLDERGIATYDFAVGWELRPTSVPAGHLFHCGSLAAYLRPGADAVLDLLDAAVAAGAVTTFDPNVRAAFTGPPDRAWARTRDVAARCDLVKLSDEDAAYLVDGMLGATGGTTGEEGGAAEAVARALLGGRTRVVVVTEGDRGPMAVTAAGTVRPGTAGAVEVVDTVGAGDSFMSGLLAVLADRLAAGLPALPVDEALPRWLPHLLAAADAAARITVGRPGADPPRRADLPPGWPAPADR